MDRLVDKSECAYREITLESGEPNDIPSVSNYAHAWKYSLLTFLPLALADRLFSLSSLWFLLVIVLQTDPFAYGYPPSFVNLGLFAVYLCVSLAQGAAEMYRCRARELSINMKPHQVRRSGTFVTRPCKDLRVGECVLVREGARIPADMLLLATSTVDGSCHVSTIRTLGESSLVMKTAVRETQRLLPSMESPAKFNFDRLDATLRVEPPNQDFLSFSGSIKLKPLPRAVPLKYDNFLLRGSLVQGEEWILALVLYTGSETKFWSNVEHPQRRPSFVERLLTLWTVASVSFVLVLSCLQMLLQSTLSTERFQPVDFVLYVLLSQSLVPLPLFLALDLLRLLHARHCRNKSFRLTVNSGCLLEELGKVNYAITDKTGTITQGRLELLAVLIGFQMYTKVPIFPQRLKSRLLAPIASPNDVIITHSFDDLREELSTKSPFCMRFCECIALCNSVIPLPDGSFRGTSVDEEALMEGAKDLGFTLLDRSTDEKVITVYDECRTFQVICVKNFSSDVKRMRILVRQESSDSHGTLYIKGSYRTMRNMMNLEESERKLLERRLEDMSEKGLRTMVLCYRIIDPDYLSDIESRALAIRSSHSLSANSDGSLEVLFMELESNLTFLGVTGVRDLLQPGAKEGMEALRSAGVVTWLVSGDTESSTLACAKELQLVSKKSRIVSLSGLKKTEDCLKALMETVEENLMADCHQTDASMIMPESQRGEKLPQSTPFTLSLDGQSLETSVKSEETQTLLLSLLLSASSVCLNTMHPSHKRKAVKLLKDGVKSHPVVLAMGDGVNDVPMLLEADVSVGLRGDRAEGVSNVNLSSFSALPQLLIRSGRRGSVMISKSVLLLLYAQMLKVLLNTLVAGIVGFSPVSCIDWQDEVLYDLGFVFLPIVTLCGTSAPGYASRFQEQLVLYRSNAVLNRVSLLRYILLAVCHFIAMSVLLFPACLTSTASDISSDELNFLLFAAMAATVSLHCAVEAERLTFLAMSAVTLIMFSVYFASQIDKFAVMVTVVARPKLVLGLAGGVLLSGVLSSCLLRAFYTSDISRLVSSKVIPLSLHSSDLKSIKRASRSFMQDPQVRPLEPKKTLQDQFALQAPLCQFESPQTERRFQSVYFRTNAKVYWKLLALLVVQSAAPMLLSWISHDGNKPEFAVKTALFASACFCVVVFAVRKIAQVSTEIYALGVVLAFFVLNLVVGDRNAAVFFYAIVCVMVFLREKWSRNAFIACAAIVLMACSEVIDVAASGVARSDVIAAVGTVVAAAFTLAITAKVSYRDCIFARKQFRLVEESKAKIEQSDTILGYLLPDFVCHLVKDGIRYIAEDQGEVSVIFIDICDFESICASCAPQELIGLLDEVFQRIDELCSSLQVAKIETVGKTYLACAGLRDFEVEHTGEYAQIQHAKRALELAFAVLRNFRSTKLSNARPLAFRIGIHSGSVIAGVVGHHKPQFVLVGDTVNTASRMASTLERANSIQISQSTYLLVCNMPEYEFIGREVTVKGKGVMKTFTVLHAKRHHTYILKEGVDVKSMLAVNARGSVRGRRFSLNVNDVNKIDTLQDAFLLEKVVFFSCKLSRKEGKFKLKRQFFRFPVIRLGATLLSLLLFGLFAIRVVALAAHSDSNLAPAVSYVLLATTSSGVALFLPELLMKAWFDWGFVGMIAVSSALVAMDKWDNECITDSFQAVIVGLLMVLLACASGLLFRPALVGLALCLLPHLRDWKSVTQDNFAFPAFMLILCLQIAIQLYHSERSERSFYNTKKLAKREIKKTEQLLTQMIPFHAYESLKQGKWSTDRLQDVAILFADISGFTSWASSHSPARVIGKLGLIFSEFDKICAKKDMYKVCTIGDCYVALSSTSNSLSRSPGRECVRMVKFALKIAKLVEEICFQDGEALRMRIGVHVGEVIAGITGSKIVRYDIYGPDVIVANKMESCGAVGRVNVSDQAKKLLQEATPGLFVFEFNTEVDLPDIAFMTDSYFVSRKLSSPR